MSSLSNYTQRLYAQSSFDPYKQPGFQSVDYAVLSYIEGAERTVGDLMLCGLAPQDQIREILTRLLSWNAVALQPNNPTNTIASIQEESEDTDEIEITDHLELGDLSPEEAAMFAEDVELADWEKRSIIAVQRLLAKGCYLDALGIQPDAKRISLKRAYFEISKSYHPDRYYGKHLGSFGPALASIFETLTSAVKAISKRKQNARRATRRLSVRYLFAHRVNVQCESWSSLQATTTQDLSEGGMFILTDREAVVGDRIRIETVLPNGDPIRLFGRIAFRRTVEQAQQLNKQAGIGVAFYSLSDQLRAHYETLLEVARQEEVSAETTLEVALPKRIARANRSQSVILGVDFGTSYTAASAVMGDHVRMIPWADGSRSIPSVVSFQSRGKCVVGAEARSRIIRFPKHTISSPKRLLGRQANDREIAPYLSQTPYRKEIAPDGTIAVDFFGDRYAVAQLCSFILRAVKRNAENVLRSRVKQAVFTVPATFNQRQMDLLRRAAQFVDLDVIEFIDEPSAAALANQCHDKFEDLIGVYDFGGGTFDFSIVDVSAGDFHILGTAGDSWLGGDDFDLAMAHHVANRFWKHYGVDLRNKDVEWQQLLCSCERTKRALTSSFETQLFVPEILRTAQGTHDLQIQLSRSQVSPLWDSAIKRALNVCAKALARVSVKPSDLSGIYLSGGTSYVPAVRDALERTFRVPARVGVPPEFAACLGAGIHASQLAARSATSLKPFRAVP